MTRDEAMKVVRLLTTAHNNAVICGKSADGAKAAVIQQAFAERDGEIERLREALEAYHRLLLPVYMTIAERDMIEEPLSDEATLFSFMGSGASDHTTVGGFRKASELARQALAAKGDSRG